MYLILKISKFNMNSLPKLIYNIIVQPFRCKLREYIKCLLFDISSIKKKANKEFTFSKL